MFRSCSAPSPLLLPGLALAVALCAAPLPAAAVSDASASLFCVLTSNTAILDGVQSRAFGTIADSGFSGPGWGWQCEAEAVENGPLARVSGGSGPVGGVPTAGRLFTESEITVPFEVSQFQGLPSFVPVPPSIDVTILMRGAVDNSSSPAGNVSNTDISFVIIGPSGGESFGLRGRTGSFGQLQMFMGGDGECNQSWTTEANPACTMIEIAEASLMEGVEYSYRIGASAVSLGQQSLMSAWIDPVVAVDPTQELAPGVFASDYYEVLVAPNIVQSVPEPGASGLALLAAAAVARRARRRRSGAS